MENRNGGRKLSAGATEEANQELPIEDCWLTIGREEKTQATDYPSAPSSRSRGQTHPVETLEQR